MPIHEHDADKIEELEGVIASFLQHEEKSKLEKECANAEQDRIGELMLKYDLESYLANGGYRVFRESFHRIKIRKPRGA